MRQAGAIQPVEVRPSEGQRPSLGSRVLPIVDLQSAINTYLAEHNAHPKPFVWTRWQMPSSTNSTACLYSLNASERSSNDR